MKIGLIDIDCHAAKKKWGATIYPNIALCKIAAYHKARGDKVEWATPFEHYDILYRTKIFNFSEDDYTPYDADVIIKGGTGYDIHATLPQEIDDTQPDYSIYENIPKDISYGFLTRGCPNKCKWCVVPMKEGAVRPYWDVERVANGNKKLVLMDNNILAGGAYAIEQLHKIIDLGYKVDFNQALDARLVTDEYAQLLAQIKWLDNRRIRFGCDTPKQIEDCERAMKMIDSYGFKGQYFLYCMINSNFEESFNRINYWWKREQEIRKTKQGNHIYAYAQPYRDPYNTKHIIPQWQKDLAGWVNKKAHFIAHSFEEFEPRKGFRCKQYFEDYDTQD